jgi:oxygen-dependent protoporphyrinogen oxidase
MSTSPLRCAVVGAGITGLTAAFRLQQAGADVTVFEASGAAGGSIRTHRDGAWLVEEGPNTLLLRDCSCDALFAALNLTPLIANPAAERRYLVRAGRPHALPSSPWGAVRTPIFSFTGKLRVLLEPFVPKNRDNPDENLESFARRRVGQEFLDYAVNPFVGGVYACAPADLCVRHALPRLWRLEQNHGSLVRGTIALMRAKRRTGDRTKPRLVSFAGGLQDLTDALTQKLARPVSFRTTISAVERPPAGPWLVHGRRAGQDFSESFDRVLFATNAEAVASLSVSGSQPLAALGGLTYSAVASVALGYAREQVAHPLDGFGMLIPQREGRHILGTLFSTTLFPKRAPDGRVLLTTFVGGRQPEMAALRDAELLARVRADLADLIGVHGEPEYVRIARWPRAIPRYGASMGPLRAQMDAFEHTHPGLFLAGAFRDGVSLPDCLAAGERAATRIKA